MKANNIAQLRKLKIQENNLKAQKLNALNSGDFELAQSIGDQLNRVHINVLFYATLVF